MATATTATPSSDSKARHDHDTRAHRAAVWALLACLTAVAVVTFVLSFHGLDDYGDRVADLGRLSWLVPIGIDGLTLTAIAATFLLATAPFRVRLYAWLVFVAANAASVAGNLSHAHHRHLPWDGAVGAAAWPIMLTLASHLAIVTRRALATRTPTTPDPVTQAPQPATTNPERELTFIPDGDGMRIIDTSPHLVSPTTDAVPADTKTRHARPRRQGRRAKTGGDSSLREDARRRYLDGELCAEIAAAVGRDKRTVQRWTEDLRQPTTPATPALTLTPVNGHKHLEGVLK